jgi:hypothetical protein
MNRAAGHAAAIEQQSGVLWPWILCCWLAAMILVGGTSIPNSFNLNLQSLASFGIIAASAWRLRSGFPTKLSAAGAVVAGCSMAVIFLQLIPLPFSIWATIPGRQLVADTFSTLELTPSWMPLTLSPWATKAAALAFLPAIAGYFSALTLHPNDNMKVALTIIGCALIGLFTGFAQKSLGSAAGLHFYNENAGNIASGTFGNRNFFAAQLFTSIPFVADPATGGASIRRDLYGFAGGWSGNYQFPRWHYSSNCIGPAVGHLRLQESRDPREGQAIAMVILCDFRQFFFGNPSWSGGAYKDCGNRSYQ